MSDHHKNSEISWAVFDQDWYIKRYHIDKNDDRTDLHKKWQEETIYLGYSPNRYFDEEWYLKANHNIQRTIKKGGIFENGFQHYCEIGHRHATPHWLFCEKEYFQKNPDISFRKITEQGYKNGYDHFIQQGDHERRKISRFFDYEIFIHSCFQENMTPSLKEGCFKQYLSLENEKYTTIRTSWYFDPKWYLQTYPEVQKELKEGKYISALHHYFCNNNPTSYNPNPYFDEEYYRTTYPELNEKIEKGIIRNGYEDFLASEKKEALSPHRDVHLGEFAAHIENIHARLIQEKTEDIFTLYIKYKENNVPYKIDALSDAQTQNLTQKRIETKLLALFRAPLSFQETLPIKNFKKELSLIIISHGDYLATIETLFSLYEQNLPSLEVIIVSNGNQKEQEYLSHCFKNVKMIFSHYHLSEEELAQRGLKAASSENILFIYAGCSLIWGSLKALLNSVRKNKIEASCPQIIHMTGKVKEAGSLIYRNGHIEPYAEKRNAYHNEVSALREVSIFNHSAFFAKKRLLEEIWEKILTSGLHQNFLPIAISIKEAGKQIFYIPEFIVKDDRKNHFSSSIREEVKENSRYYFQHFISQQAISEKVGGLPSKESSKLNIVFICKNIPLYQATSSERRFLSLIDIFKEMNYHVTIISLETQTDKQKEDFGIILDYPRDVEFLMGAEYLTQSFAHKKIHMTWIIGTETLSKIGAILEKGESPLSSSYIILETIDLDGKGLRATEDYLTKNLEEKNKLDGSLESYIQSVRKELHYGWLCQVILSLDIRERNIIKNTGCGIVQTLPAYLPKKFQKTSPMIKPFAEREGLLFSLPIYEENDSFDDALKWFCLHVIPYLRKILKKDIPVWIGSKTQRCFDISFYERYSQIEIMSESPSYEELLQKCRVLIIPSRKMTLYPLEILEAGYYGLPALISEPFCKNSGFKNEEEVLSGGYNDADFFAQQITKLYQDEDLWQKISKNIHKSVTQCHTQENYETSLKSLLSSLAQDEPHVKSLFATPKILKTYFHPAPLKTRFKKENSHAALTQKEKIEKEIVFLEEKDIKEDEDDKEFIPKTRLGVSLQ